MPTIAEQQYNNDRKIAKHALVKRLYRKLSTIIVK